MPRISKDQLRQMVDAIRQDLQVERLSPDERQALVEEVISEIRATWLMNLDAQRRQDGEQP